MMFDVNPERDELDYRFSLANERTFLAWIRTSLALVAGGLAAAKLLDFNSDALRWVVAAPPMLAGTAMAAEAVGRWRRYEAAMRAGRRLPTGRVIPVLGIGLCVYAIVVLAAAFLDG
jgi:putative membrane protein